MSSSRSSQTIVGNGNVQISVGDGRLSRGLGAVLNRVSSNVIGDNNLVVNETTDLDSEAVTAGSGSIQTVDFAEVNKLKSLYVDIPCDVRVNHSAQTTVSVTGYERSEEHKSELQS